MDCDGEQAGMQRRTEGSAKRSRFADVTNMFLPSHEGVFPGRGGTDVRRKRVCVKRVCPITVTSLVAPPPTVSLYDRPLHQLQRPFIGAFALSSDQPDHPMR